MVPTPIGNLEDITLRALRVLGEVELVLAEDTRRTRQLLTHFEISTRLLSYHQHNKLRRIELVLSELGGRDVALVSDAGMPSIADPGFELIRSAIAAGIEVDVLPGASAVITAVVAAALPAPGFLFSGFLPRKSGDRRKLLLEVQHLPYVLVWYEAPHRLVAALTDIGAILGEREAVVARELTKVHQEVRRGKVSELVTVYSEAAPRGEVTIVIAPGNAEVVDDVEDGALSRLASLKKAGQSRRSATEAVAERFDVSRNALYRMWLELERYPEE